MERPVRDTLLALGAGGSAAAGLYWLAGVRSLSISLTTGFCLGCALKLVLYVGDRYPAFATGESWADKRWTGVAVGVVTLAAFVGVSPLLPISNELRLALSFLVLSAGLAAYTAGTLAVLERVDDAED